MKLCPLQMKAAMIAKGKSSMPPQPCIVTRAVDRIHEAFVSVEAPPGKLIDSMGHSFRELIETHRDEMLLAMHAYSTPEPAIRAFARERYALIYSTVRGRLEQAGHPRPELEASLFIGMGLVMTLSEVLALPELCPFTLSGE